MEMDYTYGVARIRALESSLFGNEHNTGFVEFGNL